MPAGAQQQIAKPFIPRIVCPACSAPMKLSRIEPEGPDDHDRMFFECVCGFEYRLSDQASDGG